MNIKHYLLFFLSLFVLSSQAQVLHVSPNGTGNGSSWAQAMPLQTALQTAESGTQIWVQAGTYKPTSCSPCNQADRNLSFRIPSGVEVYAGFAGNETNLTERDFTLNPGILSGDINSDNSSAQNSYTVVFFDHVSTQTVFDGFIVQGGYADFPSDSNIKEGRRGGGIYNDGTSGSSSPRIRNCTIQNNYALSSGGGFYNDGRFDGTANALIEDCIFKDNLSDLGGGLFIDAREGFCEPVIKRCRFYDNEGSATGGAAYTFARDNGGEANPLFVNCLFEGNNAASCGAVYSLGTDQGAVHTRITNCTFVGNFADVGGAVYTNASDGGDCEATVSNCIFQGNYADFDNLFHYSGSSNPIIHLRHSLVDINNCDDLLIGSGDIDCQAGVLFSQDPLFVDYNAGNYHLQESSPCINTGSTSDINNTSETSDLAGSLRIQNGMVDMGCFEFGGAAIIPLSITQQPEFETGCLGLSVTYNVNAIGTQPLTFQWQKDGVTLNNETFNSLTLNDLIPENAGAYTCILTDANGESLISEAVSLEVNPPVPAGLQLTSSELSICPGGSVSFTAVPSNGGSNPYYVWRVNGNDIEGENGATYTLNSTEHADQVQCFMISSEACASPAFAPSEILQVEFLDEEAPTLSVNADFINICAGEQVNFSLDISNPGQNTQYTWRLNGEVVSQSAVYSTSELQPGNFVLCEIETEGACDVFTAVSAPVSVNVQELLTPAIEVQTANTTQCAGTDVIFSAIISNGGDSPEYDWYVNNTYAGSDPEFTSSELNDGDIITCTLTSSLECLSADHADSAPLSMTILPIAQPSISISSDATEVCSGETTTFTANFEDGGDNPILTWFVNGTAQSETSNTLVLENLTALTSVQAQIETSAACPANLFAFSETLTVDIAEGITPTLSINTEQTEYCDNEDLALTINAESNFPPDLYTWFVNGTEVQSSSENNLTLSNFSTGDVITCTSTSSGECLTSEEALSNEIILTVFPASEVSLSAFDTLCNDTEPFLLTGGLPLGGTYSGSEFIENDVFNPIEAGIGAHTVTYTFTDINNCVNSTEEVIEVELCTSVFEPRGIDFRVSPNPFKSRIEVQTESEIQSLTLLNTVGVPVYFVKDAGGYTAELNLENLPSGIYFLYVVTEDGEGVKRIVCE